MAPHLIILFLGSLLATPALGQTAGAPDPERGFDLLQSADGFLRMNKQTGTVSLCRVVTGNLVCETAMEEREAYLDAIADLENRLEAAESRIDRLETGLRDLGDPKNPETVEKQTEPDGEGDKKEEEIMDLDSAVEFAERAMRRLYDAVQDLRNELESR